MGMFDEQANKMREQAWTSEQVRGINDAQNLLNGVADGIGNFLKGPQPEPPKSSSGGGLGGLLATAALAGGLYLFSRICSSDDDNKNSNVGK